MTIRHYLRKLIAIPVYRKDNKHVIPDGFSFPSDFDQVVDVFHINTNKLKIIVLRAGIHFYTYIEQNKTLRMIFTHSSFWITVMTKLRGNAYLRFVKTKVYVFKYVELYATIVEYPRESFVILIFFDGSGKIKYLKKVCHSKFSSHNSLIYFYFRMLYLKKLVNEC